MLSFMERQVRDGAADVSSVGSGLSCESAHAGPLYPLTTFGNRTLEKRARETVAPSTRAVGRHTRAFHSCIRASLYIGQSRAEAVDRRRRHEQRITALTHPQMLCHSHGQTMRTNQVADASRSRGCRTSKVNVSPWVKYTRRVSRFASFTARTKSSS